jgi:hypothetical protein
MRADLASSIAPRYEIMPQLASVTRFNTGEFSAWRAAFRECTKLSSQCIANQKTEETAAWLEAWCSRGGDRPFGRWCLAGATSGRAFGSRWAQDLQKLSLINDFSWLRSRFEEWKEENAV